MTFTVPSLELWVPGVTSFLHKQSQDSLPPLAHPELPNGGNRSLGGGQTCQIYHLRLQRARWQGHGRWHPKGPKGSESPDSSCGKEVS